MLGENQESLQQFTKDISKEEGCSILFKNLASLGMLERDTFLNFVSETIGKEDTDEKSNALSEPVISSEDELLKFFNTSPECQVDTIAALNNQILKFSVLRKATAEFGDDKWENRSPGGADTSREFDSDRLKQQPHATLDEKSLLSDLTQLKGIVMKCRNCCSKGKTLQLNTGNECFENSEPEEFETSQEVWELKERLRTSLNDGLELKQILEQTKLKFKAQAELNDELEKRLEQSTHENRELQLKLAELQNQKMSSQQELYNRIDELTRENERIQKNFKIQSDNSESEIANLQRIIEEMSQERDELHQQLKNYEDEEELVSQEVENHRQTLEETQQYIANFRRSYEEQLNHLQEEKLAMAQELETANNEVERMKTSIEELENLIAQLRAKIQRLENEKHELVKQLSTVNSEDFRKKLNSSTEQNSVKLESFVVAFNSTFQDFLSQDFKELLEIGEEVSDDQLMDAPLDKKLDWIKTIIIRQIESRERYETMLAEKDEIIRKLNMNAMENAKNSKRSQQQNDQSKSQLLYELNETSTALDQKQEQIKEMEGYIKQLEHERNSLYRKIEDQQRQAARSNNSPSQTTQVFDMLDGTLEIAFTAEETRSMTLDQKFIEVQNIVKNYQELKVECRELTEERDYLQVTLDSVTNKLKAQQSEIEFLNRQIDVMRKEVAAFIKMDDFKNTEKMKADNKKFKQEIEALKTEKDRLEKEASQEKASLETLREDLKKLKSNLEEAEDAKGKAQKDIKVLNENLKEKALEIEALQRQNKDFKHQLEEITRLLEHERDCVRKKDQDVNEISHQFADLSSKFEKLNIMLEHEQNESQKKERNLNDLIQQVSQLIQKNEKINEQLLQEKEKARKNEDIFVEHQKKNAQLSGKVETLSEQLEEEKNKRKDQDRLIADLRRELEYSTQDPARVRSQSYLQRNEIYRTEQNRTENLSSDILTVLKLLGKDSNDANGREEAINALKKEFSNLVEQNKKLNEKVEGFKNDMTRNSTLENLNRKLRDQGLAIPEKFFEYSNPIDQIEFLSKEYDKLEQDRRKLGASLEAQKDDSAAKEYVITSLKNQNAILQHSQEALSKLREEVFAKDADKKDAVRRIEAMKSYFTKNPRIDRVLNHEVTTAEQELLKQKDGQIFELHKKIQKLLGELSLKGYDVRQKDILLSDAKTSENSTGQLNQMMELMVNLVNAKHEQSSIADNHQLEEENQKLKEKLLKTASKVRSLGEKLTDAINENKTLKQKLERWIKLCLECLETEIKVLRTGERSIDQGKLTEFLSKISKSLSNADKTLASFGTKEESIRKDLSSLAQEAGKLGMNKDIFDSSTPASNFQRSEEDYFEEDSGRGACGNKKKVKSKSTLRPDNSDNDSSDGNEDDEFKSPKRGDAFSSSFFTASHQETAKSSNFGESYHLQSNPALKTGSNFNNQMKQQPIPPQLSLSQQFSKSPAMDPIFQGTSPRRMFGSDQLSFQGMNSQQPVSPTFQKRNPFSSQIAEPSFEGGQGQYNQHQPYGPDQQNQFKYKNSQQDANNDPFWVSRVNSISLTDRSIIPKELEVDTNYATSRNRYQDYRVGEPERGKGDGRYYHHTEPDQYNLRERYNSPLSSHGNIRDFIRQPDSARDYLNDDPKRSDDNYYRKKESITIVDTSKLSPREQDDRPMKRPVHRYKDYEGEKLPNYFLLNLLLAYCR